MRYRHLVRGALEAQWAAIEPELRATVEAGVETLGTCAAVRRATAAGLRQSLTSCLILRAGLLAFNDLA